MLSNDDYHAHPAIGASDIKQFLRSPYHFWANKYGQARAKKPPTPAMQLGTALHTAVLEPDRFDAEYGIGLNLPRRSNADKALHAEHEARYKFILTPPEYEQVLSMATSLQTHPVAGEMIRTLSEAETSHFARCPRTGLDIKCRPDGLIRSSGTIVDLKTTVDASDRKLRYTFSDFGYDIQAVHYLYCLPGYDSFVFLMVENTPPHAVRVVTLGAFCMGVAKAKHFKALEGIGHHTETLGIVRPWPSYESMMLFAL